jgi:hypothetical protein
VKAISSAEAGHIFTHFVHPVHAMVLMMGAPASFIVMASAGQALWQRAPQAMHRPSRR